MHHLQAKYFTTSLPTPRDEPILSRGFIPISWGEYIESVQLSREMTI